MTTSLITVFILSMIGAWFGTAAPSRSRTLWNTGKPNLIGFLVPCFVMILFAGLRRTIGDTFYYIHMLETIAENGNHMPEWGQDNFLFSWLQYTIIRLGGDGATFVMLTSIMCFLPVLFIFRKYSPNFVLTVFFYFTTGVYCGTMNGIRQYIAVGIVLLSTKYLFSPYKRDFFKFLAFVLVAYLFHTSAIIMLPVYFVCRRKAWSPSTFMIVAGGLAALIFVSLFLPSFLDMLEDTSYSQYTDSWFTSGEEGGANILRVGFHAIPLVLSAVYYKELRQRGPVVDILINLSVFHFAIFLVSLYNWIFARFAYYTYAYMAILLSLIFSTVFKDAKRKGFKILLYIVYLFFFIIESKGMSGYRSDFFEPNNTVWFSFLYSIF